MNFNTQFALTIALLVACVAFVAACIFIPRLALHPATLITVYALIAFFQIRRFHKFGISVVVAFTAISLLVIFLWDQQLWIKLVTMNAIFIFLMDALEFLLKRNKNTA